MDSILHIPISLGKRNEQKKVLNVHRTTNGKVIGMWIPVTIGADIDAYDLHYGSDFGSLITSKKRVEVKKSTYYVCRR